MIGYLEGELMDKSPGLILLKVGGVGYRVAIPLSTFYALPDPPAQVALPDLHPHARGRLIALSASAPRKKRMSFCNS